MGEGYGTVFTARSVRRAQLRRRRPRNCLSPDDTFIVERPLRVSLIDDGITHRLRVRLGSSVGNVMDLMCVANRMAPIQV